MKKKIAVYCRVSTNSDDQLNSLENQKKMFLDKIDNDGDELYKVFYDEGLTGTKLFNRKNFLNMLELAGIDIVETTNYDVMSNGNFDKRVKRKFVNLVESSREPAFNYIYIKNTSRFARNVLCYDIIVKLRHKGVYIYFLEQGIDTADTSKDFLFQLFSSFDEHDSKDKSLKVLSGLKQSAKNNVIHNNNRLYGYKYVKESNSLVQIPEEAKVIRFIFEEYSKGIGIRRIITELSENGYYTREGKEFSKTSISRILDNEKYSGYNPKLKWTSGVVGSKLSSPRIQTGYEVELNERIESIIDWDLFELCRTLRENKKNTTNQKGVYKGISKYAGKVVCLHCHSVYVSDKESTKDGVRSYYRCKGKKLKTTKFCASRNIEEGELDNLVQRERQNKRLESAYAKALVFIDRAIEHTGEFYEDSTEIYSTLKSKYESTKLSLSRLVDLNLANSIDEEVYKEKLAFLNNEIATLRERLQSFTDPQIARNAEVDLLKLHRAKIQGKLAQGFSESDYLQAIRFLVGLNKIYVEYDLPEFTNEVKEAMSICRLKFEESIDDSKFKVTDYDLSFVS